MHEVPESLCLFVLQFLLLLHLAIEKSGLLLLPERFQNIQSSQEVAELLPEHTPPRPVYEDVSNVSYVFVEYTQYNWHFDNLLVLELAWLEPDFLHQRDELVVAHMERQENPNWTD